MGRWMRRCKLPTFTVNNVNVYDPTAFTLSSLSVANERTSQRDIGATVNVTKACIFEYNFEDGADGGIKGPLGDVYLYPHTQLDVQGTYAITRGFEVVVSLLNLNNEVFGFYQGSKQYQIQREFYNRTISFGVRMTR
jgi:hypothetical protein